MGCSSIGYKKILKYNSRYNRDKMHEKSNRVEMSKETERRDNLNVATCGTKGHLPNLSVQQYENWRLSKTGHPLKGLQKTQHLQGNVRFWVLN